jgi:hypothetical protein
MSDYFSKYKGRGGPAIEPGIIQMMGSIGDEYAKGITSFADSIASGIVEKDRREKSEKALEFMLNLASGKGSAVDEVKYTAAKEERNNLIAEAENQVAENQAKYNDFLAETGETGVFGKADEIRNEIDELQTKIGFAQRKADQKTKAVKRHEKLFEESKQKETKDFIRSKSMFSTRKESGSTNLTSSKKIAADLKTLQDQESNLRDKEIPLLQEKFFMARKFWEMESKNPGSSTGRKADPSSPEFQNALQRLTYFGKIKEGNELLNRERKMELGRLAADVNQEDINIPMPTLRESLPNLVKDPMEMQSLLNYATTPPQNPKVQQAKQEWDFSVDRLNQIKALPEVIESNYRRKLTMSERIGALFEGEEAKNYPDGFGEKILMFLQKSQGPAYKILDLGPNEKHILTPQGLTKLGGPPSLSERKFLRETKKENITEAISSTEKYNNYVSGKKAEIEKIKSKAYNMDTPEGITEIDKETIARLENEIKVAGQLYRELRSNMSELTGDVSKPEVIKL